MSKVRQGIEAQRWRVSRAIGTLALGMALSAPACGAGNEDGATPVTPPGTTTPPPQGALTVTTLAGGFDTIWELAWGPDGMIWTTERTGVISRVNPATGAATRAGTLAVAEIGEGGLMGLTFHPDWASQPWVYAMHSYQASGSVRNRLVRMRWENGALGAPQALLEGIPGAGNHNGARVVVGPDRFLYVTTGDASNGPLAQSRTSLAGKVLRLTLDGQPAPGNPLGGYVWSMGHRNAQGLVFSPSGVPYATEHGPGDNDELNRLEAGRNFGWPDVRGMCDGDAGPGERPFCQANNVVEPLAVWTPTIAPSGAAWYDATLIAGWRGSLLFTSLKGETLYRMQLSPDGRSVTRQERLFAGRYGRLRDVLVAPDGTVYLATSNRDGRGTPQGQDDRILRVRPQGQ